MLGYSGTNSSAEKGDLRHLGELSKKILTTSNDLNVIHLATKTIYDPRAAFSRNEEPSISQ